MCQKVGVVEILGSEGAEVMRKRELIVHCVGAMNSIYTHEI